MKNIQLSFVIPAKDEEKTIKTIFEDISVVCKKLKKSFEVVFIDDGSTDKTYAEMTALHKKHSNIGVIRHRGNWGKSIALQNGFSACKGKIIFTLDADLQDDPNEIPRFLKKLDEGYDLVTGWKKLRHDPLTKTLPSKIGNSLTRFLTGVKIHDLNCGFKAYKREVIQNLNLYGELYKYIPVLAQKQNYSVGEIIISHKPRKYGKSKFGWERNLKGLLDMITVVFLTRYLSRPAHFFGSFGLVLFSIGFYIGLYITYLRFTTGSIQNRHPLLYLGILLIIVGVQLITTGLIAEMIVSLNQKNKTAETYIRKVLV